MKGKFKLSDFIEMIVAGILVFLLILTNVFSPIDYIFKDRLYQIPRGVSSHIKIIAIDDKTIEELGPISTWTRDYYAKVIEQLNQYEDAKPAVIAFDIIYSGYYGENDTKTEGDEAFAKMAGESGNVVVASKLEMSEMPEYDQNGYKYYPVTNVYNPYPELEDACEVGYANIAQDSDGVVRRVLLNQTYEGESMCMLSEKIYNMYCENKDITPNEIVTDKYNRTLINYSGKPGDYENISFVDLINGKIDSRAFKDSIVLVGAYAAGMQDNFKVPNGGSAQMYGVEIHANIIQAFMDDIFSINVNPVLQALISAIIAMLLIFVFKNTNLIVSVILLFVSIAGQFGVGYTLNNRGNAISLVYLPVVLLVSFFYTIALKYLAESIKRRKTLNAFKKYVAPEIVDELLKNGEFAIELGGRNRDIACLFVDIRGFTSMSEVLEPEQVVQILNQYLDLTTKSIFNNKGTLDKFVGDATMAVFNSPFDLDDYVFKAVCAALDIVDGGAKLEDKLMEEFGRTIGFGVGVHCGPAVVGNVGCEFRMDYTAIGDTVNTAARLEANAKKGQVLISEEVLERLGDRIVVEEVGPMKFKGKANEMMVYSVVSAKKS